MVLQVGSTHCSTVAIPGEFWLKPMEGPVQDIAPMHTSAMLFGTFCLGTVFKAVDCIVSLLRTKELIDAALELLILAYVASKNPDGDGEYLSNSRETFAHLLFQAADVRFFRELFFLYGRFATHIDSFLSQDSNLKNQGLSNDEMDRSPDQCKASINDLMLQGPVQGPDGLWEGDISEWIISAARGKDEVNSNHSKTEKAFVSGKKDNNIQDDDDDEDDDDDDDVEDEGESGDEENDDGEEGEEDGNEDDDDDDDEEDEEEEEEDDEDDEEVAPVPAHGNIVVQNDEEEDDDSDEGEDEEEGVEDEDDFGEEGEDEDGEEDEEDDDDEDDEDVPEPPRKKNKSS